MELCAAPMSRLRKWACAPRRRTALPATLSRPQEEVLQFMNPVSYDFFINAGGPWGLGAKWAWVDQLSDHSCLWSCISSWPLTHIVGLLGFKAFVYLFPINRQLVELARASCESQHAKPSYPRPARQGLAYIYFSKQRGKLTDSCTDASSSLLTCEGRTESNPSVERNLELILHYILFYSALILFYSNQFYSILLHTQIYVHIIYYGSLLW